MRTDWYIRYETPKGYNVKIFDSLEKATFFARRLITKYSVIPEYFDDIRVGNRKAFRGAVTDFLEKYYSNPEFVFMSEDIPSTNAEDYSETIPEGMIFGENLDDDDDTDYEYYSPEDYFCEDEFSPCIGKEGFGSNGDGDDGTDLPNFSCNISFSPGDYGVYRYYEDCLDIKIYSIKVGGGRSNPLLVLSELLNGKLFRIKGNANKEKNTYTADVDEYYDEYYDNYFDFMSNRTKLRHINLLLSLGYDIIKERHVIVKDYEMTEDGKDYFAPTKRYVEYSFTLVGVKEPQKDIIFGKSAYPIIVLRILEEAEKPLLQNEIIERVQKMFNGTTIHRKAIGNSIKELLEFGYKIEHTKEGYFLQK